VVMTLQAGAAVVAAWLLHRRNATRVSRLQS
jgi:hypothetical protein